MKNRLKKIFGIHPEQLKITGLVMIGNGDEFNTIQEIRKQNLGLIVLKRYNGYVEPLSKVINKHPTYVSAMLKGLDNNNPRVITSKMARLIENKLQLESGVLDELMNV